ncbi:MAG: hypothetical protein WD426_11820 [Anditalea sp.]
MKTALADIPLNTVSNLRLKPVIGNPPFNLGWLKKNVFLPIADKKMFLKASGWNICRTYGTDLWLLQSLDFQGDP